jgi:HD superfamily phosphohydrolase
MYVDWPTQKKEPMAITETVAANNKCPRSDQSLVVGRGEALRLTPEEAVVFATGPVQRMARLRQTGLGYLAVPCSEHTRLVHCLGTTYWVAQIFRNLRANAERDSEAGGGNQACWLAEMDARLGAQGTTERVARIFALVHDCSLLPLGHTIKHQLGFDNPKTSVLGLLLDRLSRISEDCVSSAALVATSAAERPAFLAALKRDLELVEWSIVATQLLEGKPSYKEIADSQRSRFFNALPALCFISELVTGPLSADIFDYAVRDLHAVDLDFHTAPVLFKGLRITAWTPDRKTVEAVSQYVGVPTCPPLFRLGVVMDREGAIAEALHALLEARYLIAERLFFNVDKLRADAMLDVALRHVDVKQGEVSSFSGPFEPGRLLEMGDDAFLDLLVQVEGRSHSEPVAAELVKRRLYATVCNIGVAALDGANFDRAVKAREPAERNRIERMLREALGVTENEGLCISCSPAMMQFKEADILIVGPDARTSVLEEVAPAVQSLSRIGALRSRYVNLWSASVLSSSTEMTQARQEAALNFLIRYFNGKTA